MATRRGLGFSAMATMLLLQGRARIAEMEGRAESAMDRKPDAGDQSKTADLKVLIDNKKSKRRHNKKAT